MTRSRNRRRQLQPHSVPVTPPALWISHARFYRIRNRIFERSGLAWRWRWRGSAAVLR